MQKSYDEIQGLFNEEKMNLIEKNPDLEPEELLENSQNLRNLQAKSDSIKRQILEQQELTDSKEELGKFLTVLELAGPLLIMMLSSKSQLDTCEAIRALSFLHKYGFTFC